MSRGRRAGRPAAPGPYRGAPAPARIKAGRDPGDVLAGIGALVLLAALLAGVPYALLRYAGPPVTGDLLTPELLTRQVSATTIVAILVLVVWLAWLQLAICVVVEVYAGVRRVGLPARVPLAGGTQALAHRLVSAALLLFTLSAIAVPVTRFGAPPARPAVSLAATAPLADSPSGAAVGPAHRPAAERPAPGGREVKKVYVVQPPEGRHHESLWEIAEKCLGDGRRYREIFQLNRDIVQPDGARLRIADLIRPGWVLEMPSDAVGVHIVPIGQDPAQTLAEHPGRAAEAGDRIHDGTSGGIGAIDGKDTGGTHTGGTGTGGEDVDGTGAAHGAEPGGQGSESGLTRSGAGRGDPARPGGGGGAEASPDQGVRAGTSPGGPGSEKGSAGSGAGHGDRSRTKGGGGTGASRDAGARAGVSPGDVARAGTDAGDARGRDAGADGRRGVDGGADARGGVGDGADAWAGFVAYLATSSLAAAGLLALLGRRRREQLWRRAFGRRIARPTGDAATAEVALRLGADAPGSRMLDLGLRLLGRLLARQGRTPPTIFAVHLSASGLDLWIHPPDADVPEPWTAHDDGRIWRLPAHEGRRVDERTLADAPAPYPGLVSLGRVGSGRVLVDLEAALGLICVTGAHTTDVLSALAVELATNRWSDRMRLTLVGFGDELTMIAPERVRSVGTLGEALPALEARANAAPGPGDVLTGRVAARAADPAWPPHYLLSAIRPDAGEARRLAMLARGRAAAGYVVAGEVPHATWTWDVSADGVVTLPALGLTATAQLLPRRHYDAVVELFRTAGRDDGDPLLPEGPGRLPDGEPAVEIRVLGPIEFEPMNPLEEGRADLAIEMLVYLATHPGGVHPAVLGGVLWPRGVSQAVRDTTIARVAEWLGRDGTGRPHLDVDRSGRVRLGPDVRTDWQVFQELIRRSKFDHDGHESLLERALGLVRGPLLAGRPAGRYAWLADDDLEYEVMANVADAAHRLCEVRLAGGDADGAMAAVRAGLLLAADDEGLWRDLLRAAHATGDMDTLRAVADALHRRAASHPYGGMAPETEALIDDLLPALRLHPSA